MFEELGNQHSTYFYFPLYEAAMKKYRPSILAQSTVYYFQADFARILLCGPAISFALQ